MRHQPIFKLGDPPEDAVARNVVYLSPSDWDDWFQYETTFWAVYVDRDGTETTFGGVKIGQFGLRGESRTEAEGKGVRSPNLPTDFRELPEDSFSLGQSPEYYSAIKALGPDFRKWYLKAIRDLAYDRQLLNRAQNEDVTTVSLLRSVELASVRSQYSRLAHGGERFEGFKFSFRTRGSQDNLGPSMKFETTPFSQPPTNLHVLIGRNGVGKSTTLNAIAKRILDSTEGDIESRPPSLRKLTNLVSISFSAFDDFPILEVKRPQTQITYHYVGLKKQNSDNDPWFEPGPKAIDELREDFLGSFKECLASFKRANLERALNTLAADPVFESTGIANLLGTDRDSELLDSLPEIYRRLSSGHKIVLLTVTKLVETVVEGSLVLLDEPEGHLHPPLLSAFMRALSDLLTQQNGMAIVATHSPVVVQEVPRSCVWKIYRSGNELSVERPEIETFGENLSILTDEIFSLEVTATGFHRMLHELAMRSDTYEEALEEIDDQLGHEGRLILRSLMHSKEKVRRAHVEA